MSYVVVIEPGQHERNYWRDLWRYRELFYVLAWRDIAVRYKQTVIGAAWALIRPFLTMVIFTVVFGRIAKLPSDGSAPYALMVFAGMLPWTFFSTGLSEASNSLIGNANLISKVYFPRLIVPTATVVVAFVDFLVSFVILVGMMAWYRFLPGWQILVPARLCPARLPRQHRPGAVDHRAQRQIPRFPLCHPVHRAVRALRLAGRVQLAASCRRSGGCSIRSTRWSASSTAFAGASSAGRASFICRASRSSVAVAAFFLWFGIRRFRKTETSFADLI